VSVPTEHAQNQVQHKEGAHDDEGGEEDPRPLHSDRIVDLEAHVASTRVRSRDKENLLSSLRTDAAASRHQDGHRSLGRTF